MSVSEEQLAMLLQASLDFAFQQLAGGERLLPFAARVGADGEITFLRVDGEDSQKPFEQIYAETQQAMAEKAAEGELLAACLVASVSLPAPVDGFEQAIRVHVEAPGYSRQVAAPYSIEASPDGGSEPEVAQGKLVPSPAAAVIFTG